jgi:hypothetical protein
MRFLTPHLVATLTAPPALLLADVPRPALAALAVAAAALALFAYAVKYVAAPALRDVFPPALAEYRRHVDWRDRRRRRAPP